MGCACADVPNTPLAPRPRRARRRWTAPLTEAAAERLMAHWRQDHLLEHFRAAEWRCLPQDAQRRRE